MAELVGQVLKDSKALQSGAADIRRIMFHLGIEPINYRVFIDAINRDDPAPFKRFDGDPATFFSDPFSSDGSTALHIAARAGGVKVIHAIVEMGGNVNVLNDFDDTPLMYALDRPDVVRVLLDNGAFPSVHYTNIYGKSPASVAPGLFENESA
jgi:ankyrin repeat protein